MVLTSAGFAAASPQVTFMVNTTADTVDANPGDGVCADAAGQCSLRAAIQEANALGTGDVTIELQPGATYALELLGVDEHAAQPGDLDIATGLVIEGRGATVDAVGQGRAVDVMYRYIVKFRDLNAVNGAVMGASGGALHASGAGDVMVAQCEAVDNTASAEGGGLWNSATGTMIVVTTGIGTNTAPIGPDVFNDGGTFTGDGIPVPQGLGPIQGHERRRPTHAMNSGGGAPSYRRRELISCAPSRHRAGREYGRGAL